MVMFIIFRLYLDSLYFVDFGLRLFVYFLILYAIIQFIIASGIRAESQRKAVICF